MSQLLNNTEAAERLGIAPSTLEQWRYLGKSPAYVKYGRTVRYRPQDIDQYINEHIEAA